MQSPKYVRLRKIEPLTFFISKIQKKKRQTTMLGRTPLRASRHMNRNMPTNENVIGNGKNFVPISVRLRSSRERKMLRRRNVQLRRRNRTKRRKEEGNRRHHLQHCLRVRQSCTHMKVMCGHPWELEMLRLWRTTR